MDLKGPTPKVDFPSILSPFRIGPHLLKNRLVALPVFTGFAHPEGQVSSLLKAFHFAYKYTWSTLKAVWELCGKNCPKSAKVWKISQNVENSDSMISIC